MFRVWDKKILIKEYFKDNNKGECVKVSPRDVACVLATRFVCRWWRVRDHYKNILVQHKKFIHRKVKEEFQCMKCNVSFAQRGNLVTHVRGWNYQRWDSAFDSRKSLITISVFGFIWKPWVSSFKWGMVACSPPRNDWVPSQNVEVTWLRWEHSRKPQNDTKFDVVWNVLNQL